MRSRVAKLAGWLPLLVTLAGAVAGPGCATAAGAQGGAQPGAAPEGPIVSDLAIEGAVQIKPAELKKKILTNESSFEALPFVSEINRFDPNTWQADLRRIERYYQSRGFYQARVERDEVIPTSKDHVKLVIRVSEGARTVIQEVSRTGLDELPQPQRAAVLAGLPLVEGAPFLEEQWQAEKSLLVQRLREAGYAEASVTGEAHVDVATQQARLHLEVDPGIRYRFGKVVVATDPRAKVPPNRIIERVKGAITTGDWYFESALADAQARVFQMGVFAAVKVNRGAPDREDGTVPIVVDVREAPFHSRRTGVGVGLDQNRQEVRVSGEYTDRNFIGGLRRYTIRGKVGYAFLPDVVAVARGASPSKSGVIADLVNEFEQPRLFHPDFSLQSSLELQSGLEPAYDFRGGSFRVGVPWRPRRDLVIFPSYNLDVFFLSSPAPLSGRSPAVTFGCPDPCVLSFLEQTVEFDRRDDRIEPRRGYYVALSLQEGGGPLQGAFNYLKIEPDLRGYTSFGLEQRTTLAARLKLGTILSSGATPIVARFFSGGAQMRGFNTRRLSPLLAVSDAPDTQVEPREGETLPIGGNGLFEASTELRYRLFGDFLLALFVDAGFVTAGRLDVNLPYYGRNMLAAAGFGVRYMTAFGPIRVDLARRLPIGPPLPVDQPPGSPILYPESGDCFGIGRSTPGFPGAPEGLCTFHLSIGEAF